MYSNAISACFRPFFDDDDDRTGGPKTGGLEEEGQDPTGTDSEPDSQV